MLSNVSELAIDEELWKLGIQLVKEKYHDQADKNSELVKDKERQSHALQDKINRLIDMRADGEITKEEFQNRKNELLTQQGQIDSVITDLKIGSKNWLELTEKFLNTSFHARDVMLDGSPEEKRDLIEEVGENLLLMDKKLVFSFKEPYKALLVPEYRSNVLRD